MIMRDMKEIKKDINAIKRMTNARGRLGFAISEATSTECCDYIGKDLLNLAIVYPDNLDIIESAVIAICGYGFNSLREQMKEQKDEYESLAW